MSKSLTSNIIPRYEPEQQNQYACYSLCDLHGTVGADGLSALGYVSVQLPIVWTGCTQSSAT